MPITDTQLDKITKAFTTEKAAFEFIRSRALSLGLDYTIIILYSQAMTGNPMAISAFQEIARLMERQGYFNYDQIPFKINPTQ